MHLNVLSKARFLPLSYNSFTFDLFDILLVTFIAVLRYNYVELYPGITLFQPAIFHSHFGIYLNISTTFTKNDLIKSKVFQYEKKGLIIIITLGLKFCQSFLRSKSIESPSGDLRVEKLETTFVAILEKKYLLKKY